MVLTRSFGCATPVVASDIEGYRDVVTAETAITVPPDDPAALSAGIEAMLSRTRRGGRRWAAARALAKEHYGWADIAARLEGVYARVIDDHGARRAA